MEELRRWLKTAEELIFDETIPLESKWAIITQRNVILKFIELPDDLINIEKLKDISNTDTNES